MLKKNEGKRRVLSAFHVPIPTECSDHGPKTQKRGWSRNNARKVKCWNWVKTESKLTSNYLSNITISYISCTSIFHYKIINSGQKWLHKFHFHIFERLQQVEPPLPFAVLSLQTPSIETAFDMNLQRNANIVPCTELQSPAAATRSDVHRIKSCLGKLITACLCGLVFLKAHVDRHCYWTFISVAQTHSSWCTKSINCKPPRICLLLFPRWCTALQIILRTGVRDKREKMQKHCLC